MGCQRVEVTLAPTGTRYARVLRAYRLREKAKGLGPAERVTRDATLMTQTSKKEGAVSLATGEIAWQQAQRLAIATEAASAPLHPCPAEAKRQPMKEGCTARPS
jgi:hypothetical protein